MGHPSSQPPIAAQVSDLSPFLEASEIIDWNDSNVRAKAADLAAGADDAVTVARRCFEWVRDSVEHSVDARRGPVTCKASEVLHHGTGYCYAKSHLLAALLRANGIPAGFCYQRLSVDDTARTFCLHGLNALYLPPYGWYRVDARGNKSGVDAQFCPPEEQLAFKLSSGERDFQEILAAPLPLVVETLQRFHAWEDVLQNLPDCGPGSLTGDRDNSNPPASPMPSGQGEY